MPSIMDGLETTKQVEISRDPFEMIVGQEHAVSLVQSAVKQRRHVLLCGVPGIGKSMIAKAAYSLLAPPKDEIRLRYNPSQPDRPQVIVMRPEYPNPESTRQENQVHDEFYITPDRLPFDISVKMGFRCPSCQKLRESRRAIYVGDLCPGPWCPGTQALVRE